MKIFQLTFIVLILLLSPLAQALQYTDKELPIYTLVAVFNSDAPPYLWRDKQTGHIIGSTIDAHEALARKLGYRLNWRFYSLFEDDQEVINEYQQGKIDMILSNPPVDLLKEKLINIPFDMFSITLNCLVRNEAPLNTLPIIEFSQYQGIIPIGTKRAFEGFSKLHPLIKKFGSFQITDRLESSISKVLSGEADYTINEKHTLTTQIHNLGLSDRLLIRDEPLGTIDSTIFINPHSQMAALKDDHLNTMRTMKKNGGFKRIMTYNMQRYIRQSHEEYGRY